MTSKNLTFSERRRLLAAQRGETLPEAPKPTPEVDPEDIPDVLGDRSPEEDEIDRLINGVSVLEAYQKWCGKKVDERTLGRREGIMVSCPKPDHPDKTPSAWLNLDKDTWFCGGCQEGGDGYDIAAYHFGFDVPGYKDGKTFHELRQKMAESYGYRFKKVAGGTVVYKEEPEPPKQKKAKKKLESKPAVVPDNEPGPLEEKSSEVSEMWAEDDEEADQTKYPTIDWKNLVSEDTFLYEYCKATANDDSPEEYHFWHGLLALGHAVGRNVYLDDTRPVFGNMLVCLLGGTGYGKSRSRYWLDNVLEAALPFRDTGLSTSGCKIVSVPASGEVLIKAFQHQANDPSLPKNTGVYTPINGVVDFDEFSGLLARANRQGNTLKPIIMGLADARNRVATQSMTSGEFIAERPFCSITASTQPKAVRVLLSKQDAGSGFLNRWVFIGGPRKQREVLGGARSAIAVDLASAVDALKDVKAWGAVERPVYMTDEGMKELDRFYRKRIFPLQDADDTDLLKRLDLLFKRLILLFCINERIVAADERIVKLAEKLLDYVVRCYGILNAEIGISAISEVTTEILRHINRHQERLNRGCSARDLQKYMKRKNYSPDLIKRALETMVALDWIELEKKQGGHMGRPTIRYVAVS